MEQKYEKILIDIAPYMFEYQLECASNEMFSIGWFGFECGNGWFQLLHDLITRLRDMDKDKNIRVTQIKEKFGGLRFYIDSGTEEIWKLINKSEEDSYYICEKCGADGVLCKKGYWLETLCDQCAEEDGYVRY